MQNITTATNAVNGKDAVSNSPVAIQVNYPYISNILILFFCGYVIAWYLQVGLRITALGAIRFEFIYAATLSFAALFFTPKFEKSCPLIPYIYLYFIVIIIQVPFSYDLETSMDVFIERIVKFAFMAFFIVAFVRNPSHLRYFLGAFLLACLKMGQEGLVGRITGGLIWENQGVMRLHGSTPLYLHPNSFSGMALGTLPFVYYLWSNVNKYLKVILLAICVLSLHIILYTGSRTGYVGISSFILYIFINCENKKKFIAAILLLAVLLLPLIPSDYISRFDSIFTESEVEGTSASLRVEILKDAWQIFLDHPFGVGVSAFPRVRMETFGRFQDTHNLYLEIATNLGIQGLIVVLLFFYKMLYVLKEITLSARRNIIKLRAMGYPGNAVIISDLKLIESVALATGAFIICRLALGLFGMDMYEIYWWFASGITIALYSMQKNLTMAVLQAEQSSRSDTGQ
jgi:putative inorganic carbon (hco3(-)) transporter